MADSEELELTPTSNPYLDFYRKFVREHPGDLTAVFDPELSDEARSEMYAALDLSVAMVRASLDCISLRFSALTFSCKSMLIRRNTRGQFLMSVRCRLSNIMDR